MIRKPSWSGPKAQPQDKDDEKKSKPKKAKSTDELRALLKKMKGGKK